jgi:mono/diheme cytochrome c family protein
MLAGERDVGRLGNRLALAAAAALVATTIAAVMQPALADDLVRRGEYLARMGDCVACHSVPGGKPYAGGLMINTPFGGIASPNITPDKATGIGSWTDEQFYRAMHEGVGANGQYLYPAFPFTSFTNVSRDDALAIKAYLFSLEPVNAPRQPNTLRFPFNVRQSLLAWRELFFRPGTFKPDPARSREVNRGAYLVEGLGHCGECHTPRNVLGATEHSQALGGAIVDGWLAPNITSDMRQGIGGWSDDQLAAFLKSGVSPGKGVVFGPMNSVVHDSLQYASDDDIRAIIAYLRTTPARQQSAAPAVDSSKALGADLYLDNCAQCHQALGVGLPGAVPSLAQNAAVNATAPNDVIMAILNGLTGSGSYGSMPGFAATLDDKQVAELTNYVRTAWSNQGTPNATPELVASLRQNSTVPGPGTEPAVAFACPRAGTGGAPGQLPDAASGIYDIMKGENAGTLANRINEAVSTLRSQQLDPDLIVDTLIAAYCPLVAAETGLTAAQKKERVEVFGQQVTAIVYSDKQQVRDVLVTVPLSPELEMRVNEAARSARLPRESWLTRTIEKALPAGK